MESRNYNDFFKQWTVVIGLEIHAQLKTNTKLFSPDSAQFTSGENDQIHPVSLALPGTLPVLNRSALKMALKAGKAFQGELKNNSVFARKNYFYPDLPKGYQISQYDKPFCQGGRVDFYFRGEKRSIPLERIHLEEDSGRSLHQDTHSLINFNRAGIPLLEIVTKPAMDDPFIASACARAIRRTLGYLEICDGRMEQGSFRCDCNISLQPKGETEPGTKVELKNINSFRFIEKALFYEMKRQAECLKSGQAVRQETRLYDSARDQTQPMRSKEEASDYRYFPDPDLLPVSFKSDFFKNLQMPELPLEKAERLRKDYGLELKDVEILTEDRDKADLFERLAHRTGDPKTSFHWLTGPLQALLKEREQSSCPVSEEDLSDLLIFISKGEISNSMAKEIFVEMWDSGQKPEQIIRQKNLRQISGSGELEALADKVLTNHPRQVKDYKEGRTKLFGFFVGQAMKESKGQANPQKLSEILKQKLDTI